MTYFWEGPYAETPEWGRDPQPIGLRVPPELVRDHTVPHELQEEE